jgi:hypothetical protein
MCNAERENFKRLDMLSQEFANIQELTGQDEQFLKLNIGGTSFLLLTDSIRRSEQTSFLAKFHQLSHNARLKVADAYLDATGEYYLQRSSILFDAVFQFYATGVVHRPPEVCAAAFLAELDFWHIKTACIGSCCAEIVPRKKPEVKNDDKVDDATFDSLIFGKLRRRMWTFFERPGSSTKAKNFQMLSTLFVVISVIGMSFATIPNFQVIQYMSLNETDNEPMRVEHPIFVFAERLCIVFFTIEYTLRFFAAPQKCRFALQALNVVDLLAIIPFYLELTLTLSGVDDKKLRDYLGAFLVVRILRVLRVIRIIKLGRFSTGLQAFGMTLKRSQKHLQIMIIGLLTGVIFFSTMIYFLEKDEKDTQFTSIPASRLNLVLFKIVQISFSLLVVYCDNVSQTFLLFSVYCLLIFGLLSATAIWCQRVWLERLLPQRQ